MLVLDTDHLVELDRGSATRAALQRKLEDAGDEIATTIILAEEQFRGWLAQIHRQRDPHHQIDAYQRLQRRIAFFAMWLCCRGIQMLRTCFKHSASSVFGSARWI